MDYVCIFAVSNHLLHHLLKLLTKMTMDKAEITDKQWQVVLDLIAKIGMSQVKIGSIIGLTRAAVCNKMNPNFPDGFTQAQKQKINHYILCMGKVILGELGGGID